MKCFTVFIFSLVYINCFSQQYSKSWKDLNYAFIIMVNNGKTIDSAEVKSSTIYFRASAFFGSGTAPLYGGYTVPGSGNAFFSYSLDNKSFIKIGNELKKRFNLKIFTGNKFCLFNYATKETGGYVDIDWFRTDANLKN